MTTPPGSVRRRRASKSTSTSTSTIATTPRRGSALLCAVLLALSLLAALSLVAHAAEEDETLAISTFRLDLTMERTDLPDNGDSESSSSSSSSSWESVDSTIQSAAEKHLASVYALELDSTPTQVLLTVVSASPDDDNEGYAQGDSGIIVRRSFLGGVVGLPPDGPPPPTRSELDGVTLKAFEIPGYGEYFLRALRDSGDPGLDGLLLIGAGAVDGGGGYVEDDGPQSAFPDSAAASSSSSPAAGSGQVVIMGQAMNVWAIAAVAALGAMFLVIVLCTSILYCDWRGRRRRRERKRAERNASAGNARGAPRPSHDRRLADVEMADMEDDGGKRGAKHDLHVLIPAMSDETEGIEISPATTNSSSRGRPSFANRATSSGGVMGGGGGSGNGGGGGSNRPPDRVVVTKKYRGSNESSFRRQQQKLQSQSQSQSPPGDVDVTDDNIGDVVVVAAAAAGPTSPADDYAIEEASRGGEDAYSVGEDTAAMLYPNINRNRGSSRDYGAGGYASDDFDGYSIDGMSAIGVGGGADGGYSQFGGSGGGSGGGGGGGGVHRPAARKAGGGGGGVGGGRDIYYSGSDVPRDFDSVWGDDTDDDESRASRLVSASRAGDARGDNRLSLLAEAHEVEEGGSRASAAGGSVYSDIGDDSASEVYGSDGDGAGAFTLELLGKGVSRGGAGGRGGGGGGGGRLLQRTASTGEASSSGGADDDDSILGEMYRDDETESARTASTARSTRLPDAGVGGFPGMVGDDDLSAIVALEDAPVGGEGDAVPGGGDGDGSVGSDPSWAAPIQSALQRSVRHLFRTSSTSPPVPQMDTPRGDEREAGGGGGAATPPTDPADAAPPGGKAGSSPPPGKVRSVFLDRERHQQQELSTNEKFVSSLLGGSDESSVGSKGSRGSHRSDKSGGSHRSAGATTKRPTSRDETTAKSSNDRALGLTNSMDEEVDEDPAAMIDNINTMLSECREILDTEKAGVAA